MKTLLIIHIFSILMSFLKLLIISMRIKREYVLPKNNKPLLERILGDLYYTILYLIPPVAILSLFVSEDAIVEKVTSNLIKKDAELK
jgi:hypothetical protein